MVEETDVRFILIGAILRVDSKAILRAGLSLTTEPTFGHNKLIDKRHYFD